MSLTYKCVMSPTNDWVLWHIWKSRYIRHTLRSCILWYEALCHTCEWVMSHIWMSHVTHMNESCYTCESVISHMWMSHVTHVNESCHTCEWVMSHMWMSHVNEWHIWKSRDTRHTLRSCTECIMKSQVSFAEYSLLYRALLQKRPRIFLILLTNATPHDTLSDPALSALCYGVALVSRIKKILGLFWKRAL